MESTCSRITRRWPNSCNTFRQLRETATDPPSNDCPNFANRVALPATYRNINVVFRQNNSPLTKRSDQTFTVPAIDTEADKQGLLLPKGQAVSKGALS
jgi:hypothetical protein